MKAMLRPLLAAQNLLDRTRTVDFLAPLLLRAYLVPVFWSAANMKWDPFDPESSLQSTIDWFGNPDWGLGLPAPALMAFLAWAAEYFGAICLALGLATRWIAVPLMVTMVVAATTVHWDHGWAAIAPSNPSPICVEGSEAHADAGPLKRLAQCYNVNERTIGAAERLQRAKSILREHGNYDWLTERGGFAVLNNGIEFAATYFIMLLALFFFGAGRFVSVDYWLARACGRADADRGR